jgi:hypothetical protein
VRPNAIEEGGERKKIWEIKGGETRQYERVRNIVSNRGFGEREEGGRKVREREGAGLSFAKMLRRLCLPSTVLRGLLTSKLKAST